MVTRSPSTWTVEPMSSRRRSIVRRSRTGGMRSRMTGSSVRSVAASAGRAEFFEPLVGIVPLRGRPPCITNLSILFLFRFPVGDGGTYVVAGRSEETLRLVKFDASGGGDDAQRAIKKFFVFGLNVDHEVAADVAEADEGSGGQHVQH